MEKRTFGEPESGEKGTEETGPLWGPSVQDGADVRPGNPHPSGQEAA